MRRVKTLLGRKLQKTSQTTLYFYYGHRARSNGSNPPQTCRLCISVCRLLGNRRGSRVTRRTGVKNLRTPCTAHLPGPRPKRYSDQLR